MPSNMTERKRILVFAHDGRGLGHLRRLSRIAAQVADEASVLFVTGHRWIANFLPATCEFVHIPSLDSIHTRRSRHWGVLPFTGPEPGIGIKLRKELLRQCFDTFRPNALLVDYLPMGIDHELLAMVQDESMSCKKYFILRGVLGDPHQVWSDVLTPQAFSLLRNHYTKILVTCDKRIVDVPTEYQLGPEISAKVSYTGYVGPTIQPADLVRVRKARNIPDGKKWVVCAAGGGKDGEELIEACWALALQYPECHFDIIAGPRSGLLVHDMCGNGQRIMAYQDDFETMPEKLAAADIVVIRGGYNSLIEAALGTAHMIVWPYDQEQSIHTRRLAQYRQLQAVDTIENLEQAFNVAVCSQIRAESISGVNTDGANATASLLLRDLDIGTQTGNVESQPILVGEAS